MGTEDGVRRFWTEIDRDDYFFPVKPFGAC